MGGDGRLFQRVMNPRRRGQTDHRRVIGAECEGRGEEIEAVLRRFRSKSFPQPTVGRNPADEGHCRDMESPCGSHGAFRKYPGDRFLHRETVAGVSGLA